MLIKNLCSVIPAYNEARTIGNIVKRLKDKHFTVYVIDDGSSDDTGKIAVEAGAILIANKTNLGKGAALREGFSIALKSDHDAVLLMDGDDQHDISDIAHLVNKMHQTNADIVIGNRMLDTQKMPIARKVINHFMSFLLSIMSGQRVPDTQCGFRLVKKEVLKAIELESSNYEIESELILKAARHGFNIQSVSIKSVYEDQKSKINPFIDTLRFIRLLAKTIFNKR